MIQGVSPGIDGLIPITFKIIYMSEYPMVFVETLLALLNNHSASLEHTHMLGIAMFPTVVSIRRVVGAVGCG